MLGSLLRSLLGKRVTKRSTDTQAPIRASDRGTQLLEQAGQALAAGRYADALDAGDAVLRVAPDLQDGLFIRGSALAGLGRLDAARQVLAEALRNRPEHVPTQLQLGIVLHRLGEYARAIDVLADACEDSQAALEAHLWTGDAAAKLGQYEQAAIALERALAIDAGRAQVHASLALILLRHLERPEEALHHSRIAFGLDPSPPVVRLNHALALQGSARYDEALRIYATLLDEPHYAAMARTNAALIRLGRGEFGAAWDDYESRRALDEFEYAPPGIADWEGEPLASKRILAYWEQGLGDEIMFASCLPDLMHRSSQCVVQCSPRLAPLFQRSFPGMVVRGARAGEFSCGDQVDVRVAFGSLPRFFRRDREDFPRHGSYLRADPDRVAHWSNIMEERFGRGPKVGLSWRGGLAHTRRSLRSVPLEQMLPLMRARTDCGFVSLQYGDCAEDLARMSDMHDACLAHWPEVIEDYDETAALVSALDVVITVCTAVAHLAGALGKPVWVLVPSVPEWRYLHAGDHMPWYPSMRLYRARQPGEWHSVVAELAQTLTRFEVGRPDADGLTKNVTQ